MSQTVTVNEEFLRALSTGLHGLAQPLAIISGYLELSLDQQNGAPSRELTERLLQESQRATGIARFVSQLTRFQRPAPDVQDVLVSEVIEGVLADTRRLWEDAQIELLFRRPEHEQRVSISPVRLREVVFNILEAIRMVSAARDVVRLDVRPQDDRITLQIAPDQGTEPAAVTAPSTDSSHGTRALALAQAVVNNAGGTFSGSLEPLFIRAEFPVATGTTTFVSTSAQAVQPF